MKRFSLLKLGALTAAVVCLLPPATVADSYDKKTIVTFDQPTEVPGIVLQPGKYVIKLLQYPSDSSDRHIVEIMNEKMDHLYALTIAVSAEKIERSGKTVLTFYEGANGQPRALKFWFWPGDRTGQEFLYPKDQAARIASNTNQKVAEGSLPTVAESGQSLAPDNAKGATVQSSQQTQPAAVVQSSQQTKPVAAPFAASAAEPTPAASPVVIAQNTPPPSPAAETSQSSIPAVPSDANSSDKTLPQTASNLPLIGALGILSLAGAILMASVRRRRSL